MQRVQHKNRKVLTAAVAAAHYLIPSAGLFL